MLGDEAPRGGILESLNGTPYPMKLRIGEIERFEDRHRGVFDLWDGFFRNGVKPTSKEVRDIVCLGLVGGGLKEAKADIVIAALGVDDLLAAFDIAQALIGVAFIPDVADKKKAQDQPQPDLTPES